MCVGAECHPQPIAVVATRAEPLGTAPLHRLPDARQAEGLTSVDRQVEVLATDVIERVEVAGRRVTAFGARDVESDDSTLAPADGKIRDLDVAMAEVLPELGNPALAPVSLRALLEMRSGILFDADDKLFGGEDGTPGAVLLNRGSDDEQELPSKFPYRKAAAGGRPCLVSPCGGGYGDPPGGDRAARRGVRRARAGAGTAPRRPGRVVHRPGHRAGIHELFTADRARAHGAYGTTAPAGATPKRLSSQSPPPPAHSPMLLPPSSFPLGPMAYRRNPPSTRRYFSAPPE